MNPSTKIVSAVTGLLLLALAAFPDRTRAEVYATRVISVTGTFGNPGDLSSNWADAAAAVLGPHDGRFIQLSDNTSITLNSTNVQGFFRLRRR